jgi:hypothetical protein
MEGVARACRGLAGAHLFRGSTAAALPLLHEAEVRFESIGMTVEVVHSTPVARVRATWWAKCARGRSSTGRPSDTATRTHVTCAAYLT